MSYEIDYIYWQTGEGKESVSPFFPYLSKLLEKQHSLKALRHLLYFSVTFEKKDLYDTDIIDSESKQKFNITEYAFNIARYYIKMHEDVSLKSSTKVNLYASSGPLSRNSFYRLQINPFTQTWEEMRELTLIQLRLFVFENLGKYHTWNISKIAKTLKLNRKSIYRMIYSTLPKEMIKKINGAKGEVIQELKKYIDSV